MSNFQKEHAGSGSKFFFLIISLFLFLFLTAVQAGEISLGEDNLSLDELAAAYDKYGCPGVVTFSPEKERLYNLIALEDLLVGLISGRSASSISGDMIGNVRITSLTRKVNENYIRLNEYANRRDIKNLIKEDLKSLDGDFGDYDKEVFIGEIYELLKESQYVKNMRAKTLHPMASMTIQEAQSEIVKIVLFILSCQNYEMIFVEGSEGDRIVGQYLISLANTARSINLNKLNEILAD